MPLLYFGAEGVDVDHPQGIPRSYRTAYQVVLLFSAPLLVGGVHESVVIVLSWLSILFLALMACHVRLARRRLELPWIAWVLLGLTLWTGFQLVPLPLFLLDLVAPASAELYRFVLFDLGEPAAAAWRPLSLSPRATALELTKLAGLTALLVAGANTHRRPDSRERIVFALAIAGGLVSMLALAGVAMESRDYLGIYDPRAAWDPRVAHGPFVNPNHLAGFLGLAAFAAFGYAAIPRQQRGKGAFAAALGATSVAGLAMSGSRGGIIAGVATLPLFVLLLLRARRGGRPGLLPATLCGLILLVGAATYPRLSRSLDLFAQPAAVTEEQKIRSWAATLELIADNPWVGTGRGAFAQAYTRHKTLPIHQRFTHAENEPLQALADWGIPVGGAAVAAFLLLWLQLTHREMRSIDAGLASGLTYLGLQNLVDFNLQFLGVGIPAILALGLLVRASRPHQPSLRSPPTPPAQSKAGGLLQRLHHRGGLPVLLAVLALASLLSLRGRDAAAWLAELKQLEHREPLDRAELRRQAAGALDREPAEYLVPLLAARACFAHRRPRPEVPPGEIAHWLNKALYLCPTAPGAHLLTARLLLATGHRGQALIEYRDAARYGAPLSPLVRELIGNNLTGEELLAALPHGPDELRVLSGELLKRRRWPDADRVFVVMGTLPQARIHAARQRAELALTHGTAEEALARSRELLALAPDQGASHFLLGRALVRANLGKEAATAFAAATRLDPGLDKAWNSQLNGLAMLGEWDRLSGVLEQFRPFSMRSARASGYYHHWAAQLSLSRKNLAQAILSLGEAVAADPATTKYALQLAALRERVGDVHGALAALQLARRRGCSKAEGLIGELRSRHLEELLPEGPAPVPKQPDGLPESLQPGSPRPR